MNISWKVCAYLLLSTALLGHGGILLMNKQAGPFTVSLFAADAPLRAGPNDFSVMVQSSADPTPLLDARVTLAFNKPGEPEIRSQAIAGKATNQILYSSAVSLLAAGTWHLRIQIQRSETSASCDTALNVEPAQPPLAVYWPYFAIVPLGVAAYALNQHLKSQRQKRRP